MIPHAANRRLISVIICALSAVVANHARATDFTSSNFKVIDPVISLGGGRETSSSFQLERSVGQPAIGISNATNFLVKGGFLYFPAPVAAPPPAPPPTPAPPPPPGGGGPFPPPGSKPPVIPPIIIPGHPPLPRPVGKCGFADFNCDGKVDIADLSAFLFLSDFSPQSNPADLNEDGTIGLADTSVLFYYWTEAGTFKLPTFANRPTFVFPEPFTFEKIGQASALAQGRKQPKFGIQEELRTNVFLAATSTLLLLITRLLDLITGWIFGFLHFFKNSVR